MDVFVLLETSKDGAMDWYTRVYGVSLNKDVLLDFLEELSRRAIEEKKWKIYGLYEGLELISKQQHLIYKIDKNHIWE